MDEPPWPEQREGSNPAGTSLSLPLVQLHRLMSGYGFVVAVECTRTLKPAGVSDRILPERLKT